MCTRNMRALMLNWYYCFVPRNGCICGGRVSEYLLERSRIVGQVCTMSLMISQRFRILFIYSKDVKQLMKPSCSSASCWLVNNSWFTSEELILKSPWISKWCPTQSWYYSVLSLMSCRQQERGTTTSSMRCCLVCQKSRSRDTTWRILMIICTSTR